jgi:hypothetical protein
MQPMCAGALVEETPSPRSGSGLEYAPIRSVLAHSLRLRFRSLFRIHSKVRATDHPPVGRCL